MKHTLPKVIHSLVLGVLVIVLVLVVWQPVLPSSWIIHGLARQIDPQSLSLEEPAVLRFELAGRGGGDYNLIISRDGVEVTEGDTGHVDLIIRTRATDFNQLMFQMAQGKADEFVFARLVISNVLKIAGDLSVLELLQPTDEGKP